MPGSDMTNMDKHYPAETLGVLKEREEMWLQDVTVHNYWSLHQRWASSDMNLDFTVKIH